MEDEVAWTRVMQTEMEKSRWERYLVGRFIKLANDLNVSSKEEGIIKDNFRVSFLGNWVDVI